MFNSHKLSQTSKEIIIDNSAHIFVSVASMWEIAIKNRTGKLPLPNSLSNTLKEIEFSGFGIVGIERQSLEIFNELPLLHRDPFDGIIIATALLKNMTIVTADNNIQKYDVPWVW